MYSEAFDVRWNLMIKLLQINSWVLLWKKFWKPVNIWCSYEAIELDGLFLEHPRLSHVTRRRSTLQSIDGALCSAAAAGVLAAAVWSTHGWTELKISAVSVATGTTWPGLSRVATTISLRVCVTVALSHDTFIAVSRTSLQLNTSSASAKSLAFTVTA